MKFAMWNGKLSTRYVTGLRSVLVLKHYDGFSIRPHTNHFLFMFLFTVTHLILQSWNVNTLTSAS